MFPGDKMGTADDVQRALDDAQLALERGFALPDTVVPFGIEVVPDGQDRFRASHRDWEQMAAGRDVLQCLADCVKAEERQDRVLPLRDLRLTEYGELIRRVGHPDPCGTLAESRVLTEHAWRQLTGFAYSTSADGEERERRRVFPFGASQYLADPETPLVRRGSDVSYHLGRCPQSAQTLIRGRKRGDAAEIFAVLGPRYQTAADADKVAGILQQQQAHRLKGARGECMYKGGRWHLDLLWHSILPETSKVVAGEVFKAGIRVSSADDGSRGKEYVDRLVAAHHQEGGWTADPKHVITVADGVNAVSRAAHTYSWASPWMVQDQEEQAGALYQEVRVWRTN